MNRRMKKKPAPCRLPRTFHATFIPERHYVAEILRFAASGKEGTYQEIRDITGIPMGEQSGKAQAILDYCRGMGLVFLEGKRQEAIKRPRLTDLGRKVFLEDRFLKESVTQWVVHLNLCGALTGADLWHQAFCLAAPHLGLRFTRKRLEEYLKLSYSTRRSGLIGPLLRTYQEDAALSRCGAIYEEDGQVIRRPAPLESEFSFAYGAWLLQLMVDHFPNTNQVPVSELEACAGWQSICGWDTSGTQKVLLFIENKGLIEVDRHMNPWILRGRVWPQEAWGRLYEGLV